MIFHVTVGELRYSTHHLRVVAGDEDEAVLRAKKFVSDPEGRPSPEVTYESRPPIRNDSGSGALEVIDIKAGA